jgi:two-component system, chemotaxis family, response regulator Rcp1
MTVAPVLVVTCNTLMQAEAPSIVSEILLLAESIDEANLVRQALGSQQLSVVPACPDVLSFLRRQGPYVLCARPDVILLDLDVLNPEECTILEQIKKDPDFKRIPIVVLASNDEMERVTKAYELSANAYVVKPRDEEDFIRVIRATLTFWLTVARLPGETKSR